MFRKYLTPLDRINGTEKVNLKSEGAYSRKIFTPEREPLALKILQGWQKNGEVVALVGGTYDIQHSGHKEEINVAKAMSDRVVVHPSTDERSMGNKGKKLVTTMTERAKHLALSESVDMVLYNYAGPNKIEILRKIKPNRYMYSTTASGKYFDEIAHLMTIFESKLIEFLSEDCSKSSRIAINIEGQWCHLCVFNEGCQQEIRIMEDETIEQYFQRCKQLCLEYASRKFDDRDNNSGSVIKQRVVDNFLEQNGLYLSCDLDEQESQS